MKDSKLNIYLNKFIAINGTEKYSYSHLKEINSATKKIKIFCNKHQYFFLQAPNVHARGVGCPKCGRERSESAKFDSEEVFLKKLKFTHKDKYDLSKVVKCKGTEQITVGCKIHGDFQIRRSNFSSGKGCLKCSNEKYKSTKEYFSEKSIVLHSNRYDYSKVNYIDSKTPVIIKCKAHGDFLQIPNGHLSGSGCPKCSGYVSKAENEIADFIKQYIPIEQSNKTLLNGKEIDIYIPSLKLAIEFNGLYWHSDLFKENNYHLNKLNLCNLIGVTLIQIFEDEWKNNKEIVKSRLLNILGFNKEKIYARECKVKEVSSINTSQFLDSNHIQGKLGANTRLGLYYKDNLVSLMTFGELRKNLGSSKKEKNYELLRFCNRINTSVVGGASKLLKHFEKKYKPEVIISYADRRWSTGKLYNTLEFEFTSISLPNYFYTKGRIRENRFKYRKSELIKMGQDPIKSERQIMKDLGYYRIYDSGTIKFTKYFVK